MIDIYPLRENPPSKSGDLGWSLQASCHGSQVRGYVIEGRKTPRDCRLTAQPMCTICEIIYTLGDI